MTIFTRRTALRLLLTLPLTLFPASNNALPASPHSSFILHPSSFALAPPARKGRDFLVIDDVWKFQTDPDKKGESVGWIQAAPQDAKETMVPSLWNRFVAKDYTGVAWYWREFEVPAAWKGQTVRLRFEAVAERAKVWLNGEALGEHIGGATPFEFNITKTLKIGAKNRVAVRVEGDEKAGAGIWQGALLLAHDEAYLADGFALANALGNLNAVVTLLNTSDKSGDAMLEARIVAANALTKEVRKTHQILSLTPGRNLATLLLSVRGKALQRWTPESPFLYHLQLVFRQDQDILDILDTLFGFREFGLKEGVITLNGDAVTLSSVALHLPQPVVIATPEDAARVRDLLRRLKTKKVNVVYLDAPPPAILNVADEEGVFIVESARPNLAPKMAADEIRSLILRDRSHPCLLAWNLGDADAATTKQARQLDPTRFLLVGPAAAPKLWPPRQNEPSPDALPTGLLPAP